MSEPTDEPDVTGLLVDATLAPYRQGIELTFYRRVFSEFEIAEPLVMRKVDENAYKPATLTLSRKTGQQLIDQLWQCGLRPSEGTGSAGAMAAQTKHLNDMRKLVGHHLGVDL